MNKILNYKRSFLLIILIVSLFFIGIECIDNGVDKNAASSQESDMYHQYAGSAACAKCHKNIYDSFIETGHFLTSQITNAENIKGSFEKGKNIVNYYPGLFVSMQKTDSGFYEVKNLKGVESNAGRIDIIIGSGIRGQTYLTWKNDNLFQLPVSYLSSINGWTNSPGLPNNMIFERTVNARCLECHSTYAEVISSSELNKADEFDDDRILYGIGCEKCHGPGAEHVAYQTDNPGETTAKYIINPGTFSRKLSIDLCRLCHGGKLGSIRPAFSYTPGKKLQDYFITYEMANNANIDVHGDQYALLAESKCFKTSTTLTCVSCHSPHDSERGNVALFSQKCMSCHNPDHGTFCKIKSESIAAISSNCIDCHMPDRRSKSIVMKLTDSTKTTAELLRTHLIAIYPDATKRYLARKTFPSPGK